jgi:hypothetical protein
MRRVLVVSPHFPPTDVVDMHRVRTTVAHYPACSWTPVVLSVRPQDTGRLTDPTLVESLPPGLERHEAGALPERLTRRLGVGAIGLRAWPALKAAGERLLAGGGFDLVFISTTAFPLMTLGRVWKERFGVPFVLDFQDPWASFPQSARRFVRAGPKHGLMHALHRRMEQWTVPAADGLLAVSPKYIELLKASYPGVDRIPSLASAFGVSAADFALAAAKGRTTPDLRRSETEIICVYAGRVAPPMEAPLRACFQAVALGLQLRPALFGRLRFLFVGTGYGKHGNPPVATRLATEAGIADRVIEHPDRVPLFDALKTMMQADVLLVLGSEDDAYVPSKLNQCLFLPKPILCAAPEGGPAFARLADLTTAILAPSDEPPSRELVDAWADRMDALIRNPPADAYAARSASAYEAAQAARNDCSLFDRVISRGAP